jgi:hypothetical protein
LAECDLRHELLKAGAAFGGRSRVAEVGVHDFDVTLVPTEFSGTLLQRVLEAQALLVGRDLMGTGLSHIDDGAAMAMMGLNQIGSVHEASPARHVSVLGRLPAGLAA